MPKLPAQLLLLIAVALWGISSPVAKYALDYISPQLLLTLRFLLITLILTPFILHNPKKYQPEFKKIKPKLIPRLLLLGFLGSVAQIGLIYLGFTYTTAIDGTLLLATSPVIVAFAGVMFLKEKLTRKEILGFAIAASGSLLLIAKPIFETGQIFTGSGIGNLLILLANLCWATYIVSCKSSGLTKISPVILTWITFGVGAIGMAIITIFTLSPLQIITTLKSLTPTVWLAVGYISLFAGILAYSFYQLGIKKIEVSEAEVFNYLSPIFATPIAFVWLKEPITWSFVLSAIVIAVGVYIAETNPVNPRQKH